ncbi:MAG: ABC transporter substrate-binding protein [Bacteroidales bacterium]|nr:ABC transporter substrate-binding protein [Bacteroidales bacterium]
MVNKRKQLHLIVFLVLLASTAFTVNPVFSQQTKLTYTPHWLPQAQFAGFYVAREMGFYNDVDLDITIQHPSPTEDVLDLLVAGKADIVSHFLISAIAQHQSGTKMVCFGQLSQNCAQMFVTRKKDSINKPEDLDGKRIGIWEAGFQEIPSALIDEYNCSVEWIPIVSSVNLFLMGGIDAMTVMLYNEYDQIINSGINEDELNPMLFSDFGYNVPEDGLYCLNETYYKNNDALKRFVSASLRGWEYTFANKEYALDLVWKEMKAANIPSNMAHQQWMLDITEKMYNRNDKPIEVGELLEQDYIDAFNLLITIGQLEAEAKPDFDSFYKKNQ